MVNPADDQASEYDVLIMGAGFGGLHALHRLRDDGFKVLALEAAPDTGGAWYWNAYPGARCDVESLVYSYSFSPIIDAEWRWSERYAGRDEICRYLQWVATRLDLRRDIRFNSRVTAARWEGDSQRWRITTEQGVELLARHFISAPGPISQPILPDIPGLGDYKGLMIHTARWPKPDPDLTGKRVGVIGTGSSGTQLIPLVAEQCGHLYVFMRTRNYYSPANNRPLTEEDYAWWEKNRDSVRARMASGELGGAGDVMLDPAVANIAANVNGEDLSFEARAEVLEARWRHGGGMVGYAFRDVFASEQVNRQVTQFFRDKIHTFVDDPKLAETLKPHDFPFGTKRPTVGSGFFETLARPDVTLVDVKATPIERATPTGLVVDGQNFDLDVLILASGFDALTGALTSIDVRGESGKSLKQMWADGAATFLGISLVDLPNFHMIGGPGSVSVLSNVVHTNEFQVNWICDLIGRMRTRHETCVRVRPEAQDDWSKKLERAVTGNEWSKTDSWYTGANVAGKKRQILAYTGGIGRYKRACNKERDGDFGSYVFTVDAHQTSALARS